MNEAFGINAGAMKAYEEWKEITAGNLSRKTPGAKGVVYAMEGEEVGKSMGFKDLMGVKPKGVIGRDMSVGNISGTGVETHVALGQEGGFFSFDGGKVVGRDGEFHWGADGTLRNKYGMTVDGDGGPIVKQGNGGAVSIDGGGRVTQGKIYLGKLVVVEAKKEDLRETLGGFEVKGGGKRMEDYSLVTRSLEAANGSAVKSMVDLTTITRGYESLIAVHRKLDEQMGQAIGYANSR